MKRKMGGPELIGSNVTRRRFLALGAAGAGVLAADRSHAREEGARARHSSRTSGNEAKIAWRLHRSNWWPDDAFADLSALLSAHRSVVDEVSLMEAPGGNYYPPMAYWSRTADAMARRMTALRHLGVESVGMN